LRSDRSRLLRVCVRAAHVRYAHLSPRAIWKVHVRQHVRTAVQVPLSSLSQISAHASEVETAMTPRKLGQYEVPCDTITCDKCHYDCPFGKLNAKALKWQHDNAKRTFPTNFPCEHRGELGYCVTYGIQCSEVPHDWDRCVQARERRRLHSLSLRGEM
jgi:hypothetical protein